ncbi:hypothetical protein AMJ39_07395 [candidate division TA06 bacterium DG_24]|uniref:Uncharacterized protein n=3 Tax=Bacteria division TA06 TaxID=1156500 RepID=A0A0S8JLI1_UNCT6|nr:MAG: hypothetical protein AMJ39_07395 [candidate division TA06 bacterium DG_24]KPK67729.1 MAG: hypothetical protein AMJ82_10015 [candidate division TA06 bacterium SM23_40]KPL10067.1 MAG: hypothetical protein AMJ71_04585 [candidate division TA06 bacterium SM1_40]
MIPLTPYLGAGGGWHRQDWGEQQDDFGIHFLGGVDYDLPGAVVGIMGRYAAVFGETETQQIFVVAGRVGYPVSLL